MKDFLVQVVIPAMEPGSSLFNKKGFTLIELLVIVLIIGILSSVALPQYTAAVEKARLVEVVSLFKQVAVAQRLYRLSNDTYSRSIEGMDIALPGLGGSNGYGVNNWHTPHYHFYLEGGTRPNERIIGKAYSTKANYKNTAQFAAANMSLSVDGLLRVWCTDSYSPDYGFGGVWKDYNPNNTASARCQKISGRKDGLLLESQL